MKSGYVIVPNEDPEYLTAQVEAAISTFGAYKTCPVCGNPFYIPPGGETIWRYRLREKYNHGRGRQVCSWTCSQKANKGGR